VEFEAAVRKRRMIRNFAPEEIPDEIINRILELAQHGPSAGFSQGVAYLVIRDPKTKKELGGEEAVLPNGFHNFISYAPVLIMVCVSEEIYHRRYREPDKLQDGSEIEWPTPYWFFDAGASSMIILLAAVSMGYAGAFAGLPREDISKARKLLGIPEEFHPVGLISIGKPAPDRKSPSLERGRRKFEQVVHYEHW
jgi:nitroreductase